jgi:hypothetical protein
VFLIGLANVANTSGCQHALALSLILVFPLLLSV